MRANELAGLLVLAGDEVLEGTRLDPPLTATADLDGRQVPAAHEGVRLGGRDVQGLGDVGEGEESGGHLLIVADGACGRRPTVRLWTVVWARARSRVMLGADDVTRGCAAQRKAAN